MTRPGTRLLDLVEVMDRLRSPGGCPWDAQQTHATLLEYLVEESYEVVEAVETGGRDDLREELGDLLLQVVFHARIAAEHPEDPWGIDEVAAGIVDKLVARHPHVFAGASAADAAEVEANWVRLKAAEKGRRSALDGIPSSLPALALAAKTLSRADKAGAAVDVADEATRARAAGAVDGTAHDELAYGDLLLALVARAREAGVDAEAALREAVRRHATVVRAGELARATHDDATSPAVPFLASEPTRTPDVTLESGSGSR